MGKAGLLVCCLVSACGRFGFDPLGAGVGDGDTSGDDAVVMQSCPAGFPAVCGATGTLPCCGSPLVTGGTYFRGYDVGSDGTNDDMNFPATVSDFRLDRYETTIGRFREFVNAGFGTQQNPPPAGAGARTLNGMANQGGWDPSWNTQLEANTTAFTQGLKCYTSDIWKWTDAPGANEGIPINCLTWYEAFAFCIWDGGHLPTEAEFNYAAVGGSEQRAFPWSVPPESLAIDCSYANYQVDVPPGTFCVGAAGDINRAGSQSPKGDGRWGHADLGGNPYEWMLDGYTAAYPNPCNDCAELTTITDRTIRGGIHYYGAGFVRGANRTDDDPARRTGSVTVRCARTP